MNQTVESIFRYIFSPKCNYHINSCKFSLTKHRGFHSYYSPIYKIALDPLFCISFFYCMLTFKNLCCRSYSEVQKMK